MCKNIYILYLLLSVCGALMVMAMVCFFMPSIVGSAYDNNSVLSLVSYILYANMILAILIIVQSCMVRWSARNRAKNVRDVWQETVFNLLRK